MGPWYVSPLKYWISPELRESYRCLVSNCSTNSLDIWTCWSSSMCHSRAYWNFRTRPRSDRHCCGLVSLQGTHSWSKCPRRHGRSSIWARPFHPFCHFSIPRGTTPPEIWIPRCLPFCFAPNCRHSIHLWSSSTFPDPAFLRSSTPHRRFPPPCSDLRRVFSRALPRRAACSFWIDRDTAGSVCWNCRPRSLRSICPAMCRCRHLRWEKRAASRPITLPSHRHLWDLRVKWTAQIQRVYFLRGNFDCPLRLHCLSFFLFCCLFPFLYFASFPPCCRFYRFRSIPSNWYRSRGQGSPAGFSLSISTQYHILNFVEIFLSSMRYRRPAFPVQTCYFFATWDCCCLRIIHYPGWFWVRCLRGWLPVGQIWRWLAIIWRLFWSAMLSAFFAWQLI